MFPHAVFVCWTFFNMKKFQSVKVISKKNLGKSIKRKLRYRQNELKSKEKIFSVEFLWNTKATNDRNSKQTSWAYCIRCSAITNYRIYEALIFSKILFSVPPTAWLPSNQLAKIHSFSRSTRNKHSDAPVFQPVSRNKNRKITSCWWFLLLF